jgi:hypothetical protein
MSAEESTATHKAAHEQPPREGPILHRVCITCNNMFRVTPDHYEAKQCPNCRKEG